MLVWWCCRCCGRCGLQWKWGSMRLAAQQAPPLVLLCPYSHYKAAAGKVLQQWDATGVVLSAALLGHWAPTHPTQAAQTCVGTARVVHARCLWGTRVLGSSLPEAWSRSETSILPPPACLGKEPWKNPFWLAWSETWQSWSEEPACPLALSWTTAETLQFSLQWTELVAPKKRKIKLPMNNPFYWEIKFMFPIAWRVPSSLGFFAHLVVQIFYITWIKLLTWLFRFFIGSKITLAEKPEDTVPWNNLQPSR